jgi:hypothetical protein
MRGAFGGPPVHATAPRRRSCMPVLSQMRAVFQVCREQRQRKSKLAVAPAHRGINDDGVLAELTEANLFQLLRVVSGQESPQAIVDGAADRPQRIRAAASLAFDLGIFRPFWRRVLDAELDLPDAFMVELSRTSLSLAQDAMAAVLQTQTAVQQIEGEGIRVAVLKGSALALRAYGDPFARASSDLDMLVTPQDLRAATAALMHIGYTPFALSGLGHVPVNDLDFRGQQILMDSGHEVVLTSPDATLPIDLHWRLSPRFFRTNVAVADVLARADQFEVDRRIQLPTLCAEDMVVALSAEIARDGWTNLEHLLSLDLLVHRGDLDQASLRRAARAWRHARYLKASLVVAGCLTGRPEAIEYRDPVPKSIRRKADALLGTTQMPARGSRLGLVGLTLRDDPVDAFLVLLDYVFRPTLGDYEARRLHRSPQLLSLTRVARLVRRQLFGARRRTRDARP